MGLGAGLIVLGFRMLCGFGLAAFATGSLLAGFAQSGDILLLAGAAVSLIAFVCVEARQSAPSINVTLFGIGSFAPADNYWLLLPALLVWGAGMTCCYSPILSAMANAVPADKQGQVGGIGVTSRLLGGTLGMALCSTVYVTTRSYADVFYLTALVMFAALVCVWLNVGKKAAV